MFRVILCASVALLSVTLAVLSAAADDRETCRGGGDDAVAACSRLIARNPGDAGAWYNRGLQYAIGIFDGEVRLDEDRAIADFDQAIRLDPDQATYLIRGETYAAMGDLDRAIADYDQMIRLDPELAYFYVVRSRAYAAKGDLGRALADDDQALAIQPDLAAAREHRAEVEALAARASAGKPPPEK
jgi:tetratricopeptide (TPR) repeat protein